MVMLHNNTYFSTMGDTLEHLIMRLPLFLLHT